MSQTEIRPDSLYTVAALDQVGIGPTLRRRFRDDGFQPVRVGRIAFYRGRDVVEWIETQGKRESVEAEYK